MRPCFAHEVFATAEADLKPHFIDRIGKQGEKLA
jgi:hypothetical protein